MKLYLQNIIETIQYENLPVEWQQFDLVKFSNNKTLFDYQKQALKTSQQVIEIIGLIILIHYHHQYKFFQRITYLIIKLGKKYFSLSHANQS